MKVLIVNENDEVIGSKDRSQIDFANDIFRSASLWVTNSAGDVLLAQRKFDKKVNPGKWGEAAGGIVDGDSSYYDTVVAEADEELGLSGIDIQEGPKQLVRASASFFIQWYTAVVDKPLSDFVIQKDEVEDIAWVPIEQLQKDLLINPEKYVDEFSETIRLLAGQ